MSNLTLSPEILSLVNSLKPYLGSSGQNLAEGFLRSLELISSNVGQDWMRSLKQLFPASVKTTKSLSLPTPFGTQTVAINVPFILFLVLILIFFSNIC